MTLVGGHRAAVSAMRAATAWFVDAVVLRRPNYRALRASVSGVVQAIDDVPGSAVGGLRPDWARR